MALSVLKVASLMQTPFPCVLIYHLRDRHGCRRHGMSGVSPVGAGAHGLRLPATSSCGLLLHQLTPLKLWPNTQKHQRVYHCAHNLLDETSDRFDVAYFLAGIPPNCRSKGKNYVLKKKQPWKMKEFEVMTTSRAYTHCQPDLLTRSPNHWAAFSPSAVGLLGCESE